jgi:alkylation response protein AidB-like acyl-CoA dehydrogenase
MTTTAPETDHSSRDDLLDEVRTWLEENWDPDLTVGEWWSRLGLAGWAAPNLPTNAYGRDLSRSEMVSVQEEIAGFGALGAPGGLGLLLAAPTIAAHGTQEQIDHYVRDIVTGQRSWCQLFSEPGAGSDLAGLTARAEKDGDEWVINGQKVWTSLGQYADLAMLIARTDPELPKHQGITYFALEMRQDGVEVRPLREMTGHAMFNEVFLTDARVADGAIIGGRGKGWAVANTTLMNERLGLGSGGGSAAGGSAIPGTLAGHLDQPAGGFVTGRARRRGGTSGPGTGGARPLIDLAKRNGKDKDPLVRQDLVRLYTIGELGRFNGLRLRAARAAGKDIPGLANLSKLSMSDTMRQSRDLGLRLLGPAGTLHGYDDEGAGALTALLGEPAHAAITSMALFAQGPPIYGGTDQIQRNIIGERVLGLPREPSSDRDVPFSELPKNG